VKVFLDTNVLVAGSLREHSQHALAQAVMESIQTGKTKGYTSGHAFLETYSILTRLPTLPRIPAAQALALVQENILKHFTMVVLTASEYSSLVTRLGGEGIGGGQVYDALHLACARKAGVDRIYTFDVRHFQAIAPDLSARILAPVTVGGTRLESSSE
jgi:predicted nucleic acid-binding protein